MIHHRSGLRPRLSFWNLGARRLFSSAARWRPLPVLPDGRVETVRREAFEPSLPALLPAGSFSKLPAIHKWFARSEQGTSLAALNYDYFEIFGTATVPIELTHLNGRNGPEESFQRAEVPLHLFLEWTKMATTDTSERLYLAQASFSNLPKSLTDDLPTPEIVAKTGTGDIYDTNIWMGIAPTYTPLHRDPNPNLLVQLAGHKVARIVSPEAGDRIFGRVQSILGKSGSAAFRGDEMMKGEEKRLLEAEIWNDTPGNEIREEEAYEAHLHGADGLFIPKGWWHSIKGVDSGILGSVNWWFR